MSSMCYFLHDAQVNNVLQSHGEPADHILRLCWF